MSRAPLMFNGKFLSARPTGVHRVAAELIGHVDRLISREAGHEKESSLLLCPKDAYQPLALHAIERRRVGLTTWQVWEQIELARHARGGVLVSLCNMAPLTYRGGVTMIHDAQVFLTPRSYSAPFRAWYQFALPRIGHAAARVLTVSEYSKERLVECGVAPRDSIVVVYNGVDHLQTLIPDAAILRRLGLNEGDYVLATGGAQKHKNLGILFRAFQSGALEDVRLVVAGPDAAPAFAAADPPPPPGVIFAGRVSDSELRALYENAICLAFPSTTEGFGLPPLEAMSLGCPAIVAPCGSLPEVCGDAAFYAEPHDPEAWIAAIQALSRDPQARAGLVRAGLARAGRYRWEDSARQLLDIVRSVA